MFNNISVLGAGNMGLQIAQEIAYAGLPCVLFDLKTKIVSDNLKSIDKNISENILDLITPASFEDNLYLLKKSDLIIEAVSEDIKIKKSLYKKISKYISHDAILATNSSGILISKLSVIFESENLKTKNLKYKNLKSRFLGMHFFNPPRYLQLVEIIKHKNTDKKVVNKCEEFLVKKLGKLVVHAKDSPNFMANRLGIGLWCLADNLARKYKLDFEIVDKLTGKLLGRPKSGIYRTADLVGLDILSKVISNSRKIGKDDEPLYKILKTPDWMNYLIDKGFLGDKSKNKNKNKINKGIYFKDKKGIHVFDINSKKYRLIDKNKLSIDKLSIDKLSIDKEVVLALKNKNWKLRIKGLRKLDIKTHPQAGFILDLLEQSFIYASEIALDIADNVFDLDAVMKWGFGWKQGVFEIWQEAGLDIISDKLVNSWVKKLIKNKNKFHTKNSSLDLKTLKSYLDKLYENSQPQSLRGYGEANSCKARIDFLKIDKSKNLNRFVYKYIKNFNNDIYNDFFVKSANIKIIKDDEFYQIWQWKNKNKKSCEDSIIISFKTKMAVLNKRVLIGIEKALDICEKDNKGLIIYQKDIPHFSAGADLLTLAELFLSKGPDALDNILKQFQGLYVKLKYSKVPVIAAVQGYAFGGGCELLLYCDKVIASQNSFIGLVETGIGLIPAAGGCTAIASKLSDNHALYKNKVISQDLLIKYYENIAKAMFSKSALEAENMGYLNNSDIKIMQPGLLLSKSCEQMGLLLADYKINTKTKIIAMGDDLCALLNMYVLNLKSGGWISEHDALVANKLARVICGPEGSKYGDILDLETYLQSEREVFLELASNPKSQERIEYTLKTGKSLRN